MKYVDLIHQNTITCIEEDIVKSDLKSVSEKISQLLTNAMVDNYNHILRMNFPKSVVADYIIPALTNIIVDQL